MAWIVTDCQVAFTENGKTVFPSAHQIAALNKGETVTVDGISISSPPSSLPIKFSGIGANIRIVLDMSSGQINMQLLACRGKKEATIHYADSDLPDGAVIEGTWHHLLQSYENIKEVLEKSGIKSSGHIQIQQYAKLIKEAAIVNGVELTDSAEDYIKSHEMSYERVNPPASVRAILYPYQKTGYEIMRFMAEQGCGCILADEMGLGKTLQIITLVVDRLDSGSGRFLIIAPSSLLENWRREFAKFTVGIRVLVHQGPNRTANYKDLERYDVVVISYGTAVPDLSMLKMINWEIIVADEAQNIKNPGAIKSATIKKIPRNTAIAVTGTPFENHISDIWSIMDFIFPDFLGKLAQFHKEFSDDEIGCQRLEHLITPFIIRRRVKDVADDLPERIEIPEILLLGEQEALQYENLRQEILKEYDGRTFALPMLQKLKMFCTHPLLVGLCDHSNPRKNSAKFDRVCEILEEIIPTKEKIILFTSYNEMVEILGSYVRENLQIPVMAINGATPTYSRQTIIDEFSSQTVSSLLILNPRAAGTGLNITAANRVIHYNLEWNPALEDQSSARAYRRGQTKTVFVYRLFYKGTVEETINEKLQKKREMSDTAIIGTSGEGFSKEDIMKAIMMSPGSTG